MDFTDASHQRQARAGRERKQRAIDDHQRTKAALRLAAKIALVRACLQLGQASVDDVADRTAWPAGVDARGRGALARDLHFLEEVAWRPSRRPSRNSSRVAVYRVRDLVDAKHWLRVHDRQAAGQQLLLPMGG